MIRSCFPIPALVAFILLISFDVSVGNTIRMERIQFDEGASSATIEGSITGYACVDYLLHAQKGQYMNVSMATDSSANYFNLLAPGENEVAIYVGSTSDNQYEGLLPKTGDYKIRVYQMRSAARRNEVANYQLDIIIEDNNTAPKDLQSPPDGQDAATSEKK